ncbi:MAG: Hsp20/alpha crystallin family protein [Thiohalocapsa sp.]|jgi:HSP20 family protein|uniref:Hsp20/alpha crystallin family protein n=1 Tax=Thiohalocapsa sp. TaxID=2497641 RepID=UPI0025F68B84|nr:Hsp20/alpha crystallin family protein [Thiohalocapsa sp.]MCG6939863.1 Hsp20/alpha crystallin family protein [Thiohalocapsa sp.]
MVEKKSDGGGIEGMLRGLGDLFDKLGELAETGEQLKQSGVLETNTSRGREVKGVYGFTVKFGLGEGGEGGEGASRPKVEPFGNIRRDETTGASTVHEVTEPMVDVFEEGGHVQVVAEMPGVGEDDVELELHGDVLSIQAVHGEKKYRKEVLLPKSFDADAMSHSCRNGILEVRLG